MIKELFNLLSNYDFDNEETLENLDFSKKEDVQKAHNIINSVKNDPLAKAMLSLFIEGNDIDTFFDNADNIIDKIHKQKLNEQIEEKEDKEIVRKVVDNSVKESEKEIERPSVKIDVNVGLQIHKLVQEYVDTMVKPYSNGVLNSKQINDAYAGLYEFACWIFNHK